MKQLLVVLAFAGLCGACGAPSSNGDVDTIEIGDRWATPTPGGVDVSGGYLEIMNSTEEDDRLLAVRSARAATTEIHEMAMDGAVMRMRPVQSLAIPAGETVRLAPGGLHLMFMGISDPFAEGEEIPVTLTFERAGEVEVTLPVRRAAPQNGG